MDNRGQLRVALEAEAILGLLALRESGILTIVSSEVLTLEVSRNPHPKKKAFVLGILEQAKSFILINAAIELRAEEFELRGFKAFDALHLASAESGSDFCVIDRSLSKPSRPLHQLRGLNS